MRPRRNWLLVAFVVFSIALSAQEIVIQGVGLINGTHGHGFRTYAVNIAGGKPTPITPEGVLSLVLSPDGKELASQDLSGAIAIYSLDGRPPQTVPGSNGMLPLAWSADGRFLFTTIPDEIPARMLRVERTTGRQELLRKVTPGEPGGVYNLFSFQLSADGKTYAYAYRQTLSTLYVAQGLH